VYGSWEEKKRNRGLAGTSLRVSCLYKDAADIFLGSCAFGQLSYIRAVGFRGDGVAELYIVWHAQVSIDFSVPSTEWNISEYGIRATRELVLSENWSGVHRIYHSPEPKAVATADIISEMTGIPTSVMDELHELRIPTIQPTEEFIRRVGAYLEGFPDPEFEEWALATDRIVGCVRRYNGAIKLDTKRGAAKVG